MTAIDQLDDQHPGPEHTHRTSLRRYVAEKWGPVDDIIDNDGNDSEESESESVANHFRAAISNAASKFRFPIRHKDRTDESKAHLRNTEHTVESDEETDDGRSIMSAFSKTASSISATLRRRPSFMRTSSQRSANANEEGDSNMQGLIGREICGNDFNLLKNNGYADDDDDSSTSSLDSLTDPSEVTSSSDPAILQTQSQSVDHKRRTAKPTITLNGHSGKPKRAARSKSSHEEKEKRDKHRKERCSEHEASSKGPSSRMFHRTSPTRNGVERSKSLKEDNTLREPREQRVAGSKCEIEHKKSSCDSSINERGRGVRRTKSLKEDDKHRESREHRVARLKSTAEDLSVNEKGRGVRRTKSLKDDDTRHKLREQRVAGSKCEIEHKESSCDSSINEKGRGVPRSKSLKEDDKHCDSKEHRVTLSKSTAEDLSVNEKGRGVHRTKSLKDDDMRRKLREHRVARPKCTVDHKDDSNDSSANDKRRGVHRSKSLKHDDKKSESQQHGDHLKTTLEHKGTRNDSNEKRRGVQRSKSHDFVHTVKRIEKGSDPLHSRNPAFPRQFAERNDVRRISRHDRHRDNPANPCGSIENSD